MYRRARLVLAIYGVFALVACVSHPDVAPSSQVIPDLHSYEVDAVIRQHRASWVLAMITLRNNTDREVELNPSRFELHPSPPLSLTLSKDASFGWKPLAMPPSLMPHGLVRGTLYFHVDGTTQVSDPDDSAAWARCPLWPMTLTVHLPDGDYVFRFDDEKRVKAGA
jgi:hypothetical protein